MYERKKSNQAFSMCARRLVYLGIKNRAMRQEGNVAHTVITRDVFRILIRVIHENRQHGG